MSDTTWAEAAAQMIAVVSLLNSLAGEQQEWSTGVANGGPLGDGRYPFTQPDGTVTLVPCVARILIDAGSGALTQAGFAALLAGFAGDIDETVEIIATGKAGAVPKRFSPYLITQRKTVDRDVLNGSEVAEWIDGVSSAGREVKIPFSTFQQQFGGVIDPSRPPYNVRYDYKKSKPIATTVGSNLITCGNAVFSSADLGKVAVVGNAGPDGALVGYIGQVVDTKNIRIFVDAAFTTPRNATQNRTSEEMIWGTDNTVGLQRAFDDAEPVDIYSPGGVVVIGGIAMARELRYGSIGIVGLADSACGFAVMPVANGQQPFFADKNTGRYGAGQFKPDGYTLKNLTFFGQRYTQHYSSFRRTIDIRGGDFGVFRRGAPYARIENIDVFESQWDGIATNGAFAGQFNNIRSMNNGQVGMRMGFWDLNGVNWHVEANGCAGVISTMPGANVSTVRASYNGADGGRTFVGGGYWPHEYGANWTECGFGNIITNLRMQESWGHSLCFSSTDPLNIGSGNGGKNAFFLGTFDDTANIVPGHAGSATRLPPVRAMAYFKGNTVVNNTIELSTGSGQVQPTNYATNGYWDEGNPTGNRVILNTPGITNDPAQWYDGGPVSATARGPWGTSSSSSIGARGNVVTINGATAP